GGPRGDELRASGAGRGRAGQRVGPLRRRARVPLRERRPGVARGADRSLGRTPGCARRGARAGLPCGAVVLVRDERGAPDRRLPARRGRRSRGRGARGRLTPLSIRPRYHGTGASDAPGRGTAAWATWRVGDGTRFSATVPQPGREEANTPSSVIRTT